MKFTLSWLKDHLETKASLGEICDKLPMFGLEVEGVQDRAKDLSDFIVGYVEEERQNPNADRLKLLVVDIGAEKFKLFVVHPTHAQVLKVSSLHPGR